VESKMENSMVVGGLYESKLRVSALSERAGV
jgi:hypothetical protein